MNQLSVVVVVTYHDSSTVSTKWILQQGRVTSKDS
jgi:hypothetical protein